MIRLNGSSYTSTELQEMKEAASVLLKYEPERDLKSLLSSLIYNIDLSSKKVSFPQNQEILIELKEYPNYSASSFGRIYSNKTNKFLKPYISSSGYEVISLSVNNNVSKASIHRLVAQAFKPIDNLELVVNHLDSNKLNNHINNLEWVSNSHNIRHSYINRRSK